MTASRQFGAKVDHPDVVTLLVDNVANLLHPLGWIKHPYFQERFSGNPQGVREVTKRFCEAVVLLLEKHGKLRPVAKKAPAKKAPAKKAAPKKAPVKKAVKRAQPKA